MHCCLRFLMCGLCNSSGSSGRLCKFTALFRRNIDAFAHLLKVISHRCHYAHCLVDTSRNRGFCVLCATFQ